MELIVNGRFLGRPMTGVDRTAAELTRALADLRSQGEDIGLSVAVPPKLAEIATAKMSGIAEVEVVGRDLPGHLWEQFHLAQARPEAWLLSLCNTGPVLRRRQAVLIHDAQFRTQPGSYSRAFRAAYSLLLPLLSRRADLVFTVSGYSRSTLEQERIVPPGKLGILSNGTDHLERVEADPRLLEHLGLEDDRYLLAVGSLAPHKNLRTLYEAVRSTSDLAIPLVVVGDTGPGVFQREEMASSPRIRTIGRVDDSQLKALYDGALALCLPSLTEGFGLSAVEAMRCGAAVLASNAGALPEVCGEAALLVPPTDSSAWGDVLRRLETDAPLRESLRSAGRKRAQSFTWRRSAASLLRSLRVNDGLANDIDLTSTATTLRAEGRSANAQ